MPELPDLVARLRLDDKGFDSGVKRAEGSVGRFKGALSGVGGMIAGAFAAGAVISFAKQSVEAFQESEKATVALNDAFSRFPATSDSSVEAISRLSEALATKTRFDDDATKSAAALLAQFGLTGKQIEQLIPLTQDYAAKTGKDLPDAAQTLGKALLGNGRALKDLGIDIDLTGTKEENLIKVTEALRAQVGGFAEVEGKTAAGQAQILANQFGEVQEAVGAQLGPALTTLVTQLNTNVIPAIATVIEKTKDWGRDGQGVQGISFALGETLDDVGFKIFDFGRQGEGLQGVFFKLGGVIADDIEQTKQWASTWINFFKGVGGAISDLLGLLDRLNEKAKSLTIPGRVLGAITGREHGGPVIAGHPYVVGEKRPELFVPNVDGVIVPRVPATTSAAVASGPTYNVNVNGTLAHELDEQRLVTLLHRMELLHG